MTQLVFNGEEPRNLCFIKKKSRAQPRKGTSRFLRKFCVEVVCTWVLGAWLILDDWLAFSNLLVAISFAEGKWIRYVHFVLYNTYCILFETGPILDCFYIFLSYTICSVSGINNIDADSLKSTYLWVWGGGK